MIIKKQITVDSVCCEICNKEIDQVEVNNTFNNHLFRFFLNYDIVPQLVEDSICCLCNDCVKNYGKEIAEELQKTFELKLTELKLRSKN